MEEGHSVRREKHERRTNMRMSKKKPRNGHVSGRDGWSEKRFGGKSQRTRVVETEEKGGRGEVLHFFSHDVS